MSDKNIHKDLFNTDKVLSKLVTDADHEELFTKLIKEGNLTKFAQLESKIDDIFGDKLNSNLEKFANKLSLDRRKLKKLFSDNK